MSDDSKEKQTNPKGKVAEGKADVEGGPTTVADEVVVKEEGGGTKASDVENKGQDGAKKNEEATKVDGGDVKKVEATGKKKEEPKKEVEPTAEAKKASETAVATEKKADSKGESITEVKDDALLITAEEDIDVAENKDAAENKEKSKEEVKDAVITNGTVEKPKPKTFPSIWVSNLSRRIKATDLKKRFSKHGRVITAKIMTNGMSYFGYICMDSKKSVEQCIQNLNNTMMLDRKITVSTNRPDAQKRAKPSDNKKTVAKKDDQPKISVATKGKSATQETKPGGSKDSSAKKKVDAPRAEKKRPVKERLQIPKRDETFKLTKEIVHLRTENIKLRHRLYLTVGQARKDEENAKKFARVLKDTEEKLRQEKKKSERERENLLKKNRMELARLEAERDILEKDRAELRRRREEHEHEVRKFAEVQRAAERSRRTSRRSRSISPRMITSSSKRSRDSDSKYEHLSSKKLRWTGEHVDRMDHHRIRTPPPPPKIPVAVESRRKADPDRFYDDRLVKRDVPVYVPTGEYPGTRESRHSRGIPNETKSSVVVPSRNSMWEETNTVPSSNHWRSSGGDISGAPYSEGRYRDQASYRSSSGYSAEPRDEMRMYARVPDSEYRRSAHYEQAARKY